MAVSHTRMGAVRAQRRGRQRRWAGEEGGATVLGEAKGARGAIVLRD